MNKYLVFCVFFLTFSNLSAQSTRSAGSTAPPPVYQSSKKKAKPSFLGIFKKKETGNKSIEQKASHEERMKAVAKQKKKEARLAKKPQNSNPLYFGHKRPPKKRKPGKTKWCKICEFAH